MTTHAHQHEHEGQEAAVVRDPICAMTVDLNAGKPSYEYDGHVYHFCNPGCRDKFAAAPEDYIEAVDPVCGKTVARASARHVAKHAGQRFYFYAAQVPGRIRGGS